MSNFKMVLSKFVGQRNFDECLTIRADQISKNNTQKFLHSQWKMNYKNFCRINPCSGLLAGSELVENSIKPEVFGGICGFLTGHCRLQEHLYKLKLTFTPCCICLSEDESPHHYLYTCPLHEDSRKLYNPDTNNWLSIANFINHSGRRP